MDDNIVAHLTHIENRLLAEIRENRKQIHILNEKVMSNKMKLGVFITGLTLFCNIAFIVIAEKLKSTIIP